MRCVRRLAFEAKLGAWRKALLACGGAGALRAFQVSWAVIGARMRAAHQVAADLEVAGDFGSLMMGRDLVAEETKSIQFSASRPIVQPITSP